MPSDTLPPLVKALTVHNPWALAFFTCGKDCENRDWYTSNRGLIAIHAASTMTQEEYGEAARFMLSIDVAPPSYDECMGTLGKVLGTVRMIGCSKNVPSKWFVGEWGFLMRTPERFEVAIPAKGKLGFWRWKRPN